MKPVLFIPGYPGSHIHRRSTNERLFLDFLGLLNTTRRAEILAAMEPPDVLTDLDPLTAGEPVERAARFLFFDLAKQAQSLYKILDRLNCDTVPFGWDWRRPVSDEDMQARLKASIEDHHSRNGAPVVLVVHSTGGLVARHLLEANRDDSSFLDKIERVIAFGIPWAGTLKNFGFMVGQESFGPIAPIDAQRLVSLTWAGHDLLPPDPTKTALVDAQGNPLNLVFNSHGPVGPLHPDHRGWFHPPLASRMAMRADRSDQLHGTRTASLDLGGRTLEVTNVVGWGTETAVSAFLDETVDPVRVTIQKEKGDNALEGGDGTVPRRSAAWLRGPGVRTYHVPVGMDHLVRRNPHSTLWRNPGGRNLLAHHLAGQPLEPFVYAAVDDTDFASGTNVRVRLVALDAEGQPLTDAQVRAIRLNGPDSPFSSFDPAFEGRHLIRVPRNLIPEVASTGPDGFRRLVVEIRWREQGTLQRIERALSLRR